MEFKLNTCENEYAKDPRIKREDIQQLTEWLQKQIHMPQIGGKFVLQNYFIYISQVHKGSELAYFLEPLSFLFPKIGEPCISYIRFSKQIHIKMKKKTQKLENNLKFFSCSF